MSSPTGKLFAVCAALCKLPCKYKQRSLAVLSFLMEAVSIVLDKYEKKLLVVLAAFLLAVVGFAISLFPAIKKNARLRNAKQGQVEQFFLSLIQLAAAFYQLVLTVSNEEDKIDFSMFFPLAIAAIPVIFAFKNNAEQSDSQSRSLPLTNLLSYNAVPASPDSGSDQIRISISEVNDLFASLIRTQNNFVPGSTPMEPDGHNGISTDAENAALPLARSEPASLPSRTRIEPDRVFVNQVSPVSSLRRRSNIARNITSDDLYIWLHQIWDVPDRLLEDEPYPCRLLEDEPYPCRLLEDEPHPWPQLPPGNEPWFRRQQQIEEPEEKTVRQMLLQLIRQLQIDEKMLQIEEKMRQVRPQEQTRWILQQLQQLTEPQASTSKPNKKIARLRDIKPVTKPVANVARPFATVRRRGKRRI